VELLWARVVWDGKEATNKRSYAPRLSSRTEDPLSETHIARDFVAPHSHGYEALLGGIAGEAFSPDQIRV
jgi:hypothetical protein